MPINLVSLVQQNLGYPALIKMDANTQEAVIDTSLPAEDRFSQAAIPAVLITIYKYSRADENAEKLLKDEAVSEWMTLMQEKAPGEMIQVVADYAGISAEESGNRMNAIAAESVRLIKLDIGEKGTILDLKNLMADQRNFILPYLPAAMQLGAMLDDSTLDDRTNKMQGPVSGLMHAIGNKLAGSDTDSAT